MKRIIKHVKNDKSLWKAIRLRFYTICAAFSVMWVLTGSPITSAGLTVAQQSVSFGVHYWFEKNEEKEISIREEVRKVKRDVDKMPKEYEKHSPDDFL